MEKEIELKRNHFVLFKEQIESSIRQCKMQIEADYQVLQWVKKTIKKFPKPKKPKLIK